MNIKLYSLSEIDIPLLERLSRLNIRSKINHIWYININKTDNIREKKAEIEEEKKRVYLWAGLRAMLSIKVSRRFTSLTPYGELTK